MNTLEVKKIQQSIQNFIDHYGYDAMCEITSLKPNTRNESVIESWIKSPELISKSKLKSLNILLQKSYSHKKQNHIKNFKFIDLFAGIGGIRIPFDEIGGECVFSSEIDKFAKRTYFANFGDYPSGDITKIESSRIPNHDLLLAGFPCQAFSQAGLRKGFLDTRGTLFFEIQRIISHHQPKIILLENVKQLKSHDKGRTLNTILNVLRGGQIKTSQINKLSITDSTREALSTSLNYSVDYKVFNAKDFGVPQNRERIYILAIRNDLKTKVTPKEILDSIKPELTPTRVGSILESSGEIIEKYTISNRLWAGHLRRKQEHKIKGNGFGFSIFNSDSEHTNTISARYYKDGSEILIDQSHLQMNPRKLTPRECARLQGFPENFIINQVSNGQAYKQFGNSVAVPVIREIAKQLNNLILNS